ncbi:unnamed protein product [Macrosiphum euphorbiae]|uniref:C2H2-type domain-containing protein n=1 Tax=Macrosiphum euphorbiae TaxID=13131 RepID=A0AAV0XX04_9HEMI|nr:unnamed protein product [Macrosiphum euphorbiae]
MNPSIDVVVGAGDEYLLLALLSIESNFRCAKNAMRPWLRCHLTRTASYNSRYQSNQGIKPKLTKKNEDTQYICEYCKKATIDVTLRKHLEPHENSSSSLASELSDNEVKDPPLITEHANDEEDKPKEQNPYNNF